MQIPTHYMELERVHEATLARGLRALAVCAAEPDEGVSTLVRALARRNLLAGRSTLVVDLNLHHPTLVPVLDAPLGAEPGLLAPPQLVVGEVIGEVMTGVVAPSGAGNTLRLREPGVLEGQIRLWLECFDSVIIDTSPLNRVNAQNIPAERVAAACEGALLVVLAGHTRSATVDQALQRLRQAGAELKAAVFNDRDNPRLADELHREVRRLPRWAGRLKRHLHRSVAGMPLLSLEV